MSRYEFMLDEREIEKVVLHWSTKTGIMAMEEAGELIQAISKKERSLDNLMYVYDFDENEELIASVEDIEQADERDNEASKNLVEEIGDMYITLAMIQRRYSIDQEDIQKRIDHKLSKKY